MMEFIVCELPLMNIIESFCRGKNGPETNEDFLTVTPDFVLVVDGATDKSGHVVEGMKGGRFVAKAIAQFHENQSIDPAADMATWVGAVSAHVDDELRRAGWPDHVQRPAASVLVYSVGRREIFRVGDCHYRLNDEVFLGGKEIDDFHGMVRAEKLKALLSDGSSVESILEHDPGRDLILASLANQYMFANAQFGEFAYPIVNGVEVPKHLLEDPCPVPEGAHVVMTSDGFDFPSRDLSETLERQATSYEIDRLRIGLDGARPSTKGLSFDMDQHDDQTFVSFRTWRLAIRPLSASSDLAA
jgi:hypothetical protein